MMITPVGTLPMVQKSHGVYRAGTEIREVEQRMDPRFLWSGRACGMSALNEVDGVRQAAFQKHET